MIAIRSRFDGKVVVLEEPAPVNHAVDVTVEFPMDESESGSMEDRFGWFKTRHLSAASEIDSTDIIRQIREAE